MIVDMDRSRSAAQEKLLRRFYQGYIPHVTVLDKNGNRLYDRSGEVEETLLTSILDRALK